MCETQAKMVIADYTKVETIFGMFKEHPCIKFICMSGKAERMRKVRIRAEHQP